MTNNCDDKIFCCLRLEKDWLYPPLPYEQVNKNKVEFKGTREECEHYYKTHAVSYINRIKIQKETRKKISKHTQEIAKEQGLNLTAKAVDDIVSIITTEPIVNEISSVNWSTKI